MAHTLFDVLTLEKFTLSLNVIMVNVINWFIFSNGPNWHCHFIFSTIEEQKLGKTILTFGNVFSFFDDGKNMGVDVGNFDRVVKQKFFAIFFYSTSTLSVSLILRWRIKAFRWVLKFEKTIWRWVILSYISDVSTFQNLTLSLNLIHSWFFFMSLYPRLK